MKTLCRPFFLFFFLLLLCGLSSAVLAQTKPTFSGRETIDIRVPTPGLFASSNKLVWDFSSVEGTDYCFPLPEGKVISTYGHRNGRSHSGVDIKTVAKDTIRAAFAGVVRFSKTYGGYGKVIVIRHDTGLETVYSHNHTNLVKVGDQLQAGDPIGLTGRTGRATTEHLHFETRVNGQHFNPNLLFDFSTRTLRATKIQCTKKGGGVVVKSIPVKK